MMLLIQLITLASKLFTLLIIARVVLSWVSPDPSNGLVRFVYRATEPVLGPVRSLLPAMGGFDFSPILVLIGVQVLENLLVRALIGMAM
jgi:YggT family protein